MIKNYHVKFFSIYYLSDPILRVKLAQRMCHSYYGELEWHLLYIFQYSHALKWGKLLITIGLKWQGTSLASSNPWQAHNHYQFHVAAQGRKSRC